MVSRTLCPSGLRGWTQVPLARAAWAQIPQVSPCCTEAITAEEAVPRLVAQRSLGPQPARADKHRRARHTAAGLPCAPPGEQADAAWRLCCALPRLCNGRSLGHRCGRAVAHAFRSIAHLTLCPSGLRGWTQVSLARAAWAQIPQVSSWVWFIEPNPSICLCVKDEPSRHFINLVS